MLPIFLNILKISIDQRLLWNTTLDAKLQYLSCFDMFRIFFAMLKFCTVPRLFYWFPFQGCIFTVLHNNNDVVLHCHLLRASDYQWVWLHISEDSLSVIIRLYGARVYIYSSGHGESLLFLLLINLQLISFWYKLIEICTFRFKCRSRSKLSVY